MPIVELPPGDLVYHLVVELCYFHHRLKCSSSCLVPCLKYIGRHGVHVQHVYTLHKSWIFILAARIRSLIFFLCGRCIVLSHAADPGSLEEAVLHGFPKREIALGQFGDGGEGIILDRPVEPGMK